MAVKIYKPTSAGRRGMTGYGFDEITRSKPERSLLGAAAASRPAVAAGGSRFATGAAATSVAID